MFSQSMLKSLLPLIMSFVGMELATMPAGHSDAKAVGSLLTAVEPAVEAAIAGSTDSGIIRKAMVAARDTATAWLNANPQTPATPTPK